MPDYSGDAELRKCMQHCTVEVIPNGHCATFLGHTGCFAETQGPNQWTEKMAKQTAIFLWALKRREEETKSR